MHGVSVGAECTLIFGSLNWLYRLKTMDLQIAQCAYIDYACILSISSQFSVWSVLGLVTINSRFNLMEWNIIKLLHVTTMELS